MTNSKSTKVTQFILNTIVIILCALIVMPFWMLVSVSFSNEMDIALNGYSFWPRVFDLAAYKYVFNNPGSILQAYKITAIFSFCAMVLAVLLQSMAAYPLTRKSLKGRRFISFYFYFVTLFSGGLVPTYILITQYLHLGDTILVYIIPGLIGPFNIFMMRTFFSGIPDSIIESAHIDGASELRIYATFILPLSKPVLATVALTTFLSKWNDWNTSMLYINDDSLISLQYLLQKIMKNIEVLQNIGGQEAAIDSLIDVSKIPTETVRMAMAVVVAGPALVIFPFFQKYFVKGLTVGSVKG